MTVSHAIVILLTLTCQLTPKSNSHISLPLLRLYINYSISNAIQFTSLQLRVQYSTVQLQLVQQCIQISTRINILQCTYVHHSFVLHCVYSSISVYILITGFVDPRMQHGVRIEAVFASLQQGEHMVESTCSFQSSCRHSNNNSVNRIISKEEEREDPRRDSSIYLRVQWCFHIPTRFLRIQCILQCFHTQSSNSK